MTADITLQDRTVIVTGASRGIGEAIARACAACGANVVLAARKQEGVESAAAAITAAGGSALAVACHMGKPDEVTALFDRAAEAFGPVHGLVNNAATNPYFGDILDTDLAAFDKTIEVNVRGYFFMSVEGCKLMRDNGGGAIVNTASVAGIQPGPFQGVYSISKAAVINMTKAFAKEVARHNIRVNALLPGLTRTKFAGALFTNETIYETAMAQIPLHRHAEPEEMAGTVLYLVSDASSYTTGECVVVDGGLTI